METLKIVIVNPKAKKIIKELAELKLIAIRQNQPSREFQKLLQKLRSKSKKAPISQDEITRELELVRAKRHGKKILMIGLLLILISG